GRPCILTEHGIYTNERRIEITAAQWLNDQKAMNLNIIRPNYERDLKDYWIDTFSGYSKLCYDSCDEIITLYEGNREFQISDSADPKKIRIIPNGVNFKRFSSVGKLKKKQPTVALVGRIVPIKDIKTFIRAVRFLTQQVPALRAWVIGPTDEDKEYYEECLDLVRKYHLSDTLKFTGKQILEKCMGEVDVLVLTSISEAQPLVILEFGSAGIPCVVTDVGACRELVYGRSDENPPLGQAGEICPLSNPQAVASAIARLLFDKQFYQKCSRVIKKRVEIYYNEKDQANAYKRLYEQYING
ncbi:MAG: GT4 family glycosyltransferase PelF, partial [Waddliaceae bacterium]